MYRTTPRLSNASILLSLLLALAIGGCATHVEQIPQEDLDDESDIKQVVLYGYKFNPETIEIEKGQSIKFRNKDPDTHNIRIPALNIDQDLKPGETFTYTFSVSGDFAASNELLDKPMRMTIVVEP